MTVNKILKMMFLLGLNMEMLFGGRDKHLAGEYTKEGFFLVVEERMSKYLASAGLLLIPFPSR